MGKQIGQSVNSATSPSGSCDTTSERLEPIQSTRADYDLRAVRLPRTKFYVASPIPLLAPVITTTLSLIPGMRFAFRLSRPEFMFQVIVQIIFTR
jgi:hypothetical protein